MFFPIIIFKAILDFFKEIIVNFINNFKNIFSGKKEEVPIRDSSVIANDDTPNSTSAEVAGENPFSQPATCHASGYKSTGSFW